MCGCFHAAKIIGGDSARARAHRVATGKLTAADPGRRTYTHRPPAHPPLRTLAPSLVFALRFSYTQHWMSRCGTQAAVVLAPRDGALRREGGRCRLEAKALSPWVGRGAGTFYMDSVSYCTYWRAQHTIHSHALPPLLSALFVGPVCAIPPGVFLCLNRRFFARSSAGSLVAQPRRKSPVSRGRQSMEKSMHEGECVPQPRTV